MKKSKIKKTGRNNRPMVDSRGSIIFLGGILLICTLVYSQSLSFNFVNWDDYQNVLENPDVRDLSFDGIKEIFTSKVMDNYNPLPVFTFALEYHFFKLDPFVYHLNNILLHLLNIVLVYFLIIKIGFSRPVALFTALLFALHPMRVESVAWITERKDVLFSAFFLSSSLAFLEYRTRKNNSWIYYVLSLFLFLFALLAKIQAVSLPLALLAIDYYQKRKFNWKLLMEKVPFFVGSLSIGLLGVYFLASGDSINDKDIFSFVDRLFIGGYSYFVYLYKLFIPFPLSPLYPYPARLDWTFYVGTIASLSFLGFLFVKRKNPKYHVLIFGVLFFTVNVMFMLQILGAGQGFLADRFTYIPYIGLFVALSYYVRQWLSKHNETGLAFYGFITILGFIYSGLSYNQIKIWEDGKTLWTHVLNHYPNAVTGYKNRAQWMRDEEKNYEQALKDYSQAIRFNPEDGTAYNGRGKLYFDQGKNDLAMKDFNRALELDNSKPEIYVNRGVAHAANGNLTQALQDINNGLSLDDSFMNGYLNRSLVYFKIGQFEKAIKDYDTYLKYDPGNADIWYEKGLALRSMQRDKDALECFNRAISLQEKAIYFLERSKSLNLLGRDADAQRDVQRYNQLNR
jgi:tetratricopeptide (TPR) repeat protein